MINLTLGYPPSANDYWGVRVVGKGPKKFASVYKTTAARDYQENAGRKAAMQGAKPITGRIELAVRVYRPAKRGDLDNSLKVLLDALKGVAYVDDKQVKKIVAEQFDDPSNPRVEIEVSHEPQLFGTKGAT